MTTAHLSTLMPNSQPYYSLIYQCLPITKLAITDVYILKFSVFNRGDYMGIFQKLMSCKKFHGYHLFAICAYKIMTSFKGNLLCRL